MNKNGLFKQLVSGQTVERVLFYPILMHFAARFNGKTYGEFASDHRILVESNMRCLEYFDFDMVSLISDPYRETSAFGAPVEFVPEGVPRCMARVIKTAQDILDLKNPDVYENARTLDRIKGAEYYQKLLKDSVPVMGWVEGPLAEACDLAGVTEMLIMLMMDPDHSQILLDKCLASAKDFAKAQVEAGCGLIGIGDAICSQIDKESYDFFVLDRHRELIDFIHTHGALVKLHICGDTTHLWPSLARLGIDIFDLDYMTGLDEAFRVFGPDVVLCGNINPVSIQDLPADEVFRQCSELIDKENGRKYMLSGGCEITVNTPPENLLAMRKSCK